MKRWALSLDLDVLMESDCLTCGGRFHSLGAGALEGSGLRQVILDLEEKRPLMFVVPSAPRRTGN